jgi:mannosyltransferase
LSSSVRAPGEGTPEQRVSGWWWVAILALAAVPRFLEARRNALSFEEIYILLVVRGGFAHTLSTLAHDVDQPLYHLLLGAWRGIGGEQELWLKSLSIVLGLLSVIAVYALGRRLFGVRAGIFAALLLAAHSTHIYFSQYADVEVLLWLLLPVAAWRAVCWWDKPTLANGAAFAVAAAGALYTYYFAIFILLVLAVWGVARAPRRAGGWLLMFAAALALFGPQIPILVGQLTRDPEFIRKLPLLPLGDVASAFLKVADVPRLLAPLALVLALVPLFRRDTRPGALLLLMVVALPAAIVYVLSQVGLRIFFERQLLYAIPFATVAVGGGLAALRPRALGVVVALAFVALGLRNWSTRGPLDEGVDMAQAARYLDGHARPGEPILCCETHSILFLEYHRPRLGPYRLLIPADAPAYHVSDGILSVPDSLRVGDDAVARLRASGARWWGVRIVHFPYYRNGAEAAARLDAQAQGPTWTYRKVSVWSGAGASAP